MSALIRKGFRAELGFFVNSFSALNKKKTDRKTFFWTRRIVFSSGSRKKRYASNLLKFKLGQNQNGYGVDAYQAPKSYSNEQSYSSSHHYETKLPLKLVMDPRGIVQDVRNQGITYDHSSGMLSPDKCAELVSALHTDAPKGKGKQWKYMEESLFASFINNVFDKIHKKFLAFRFWPRAQVLNSLRNDESAPKNGLSMRLRAVRAFHRPRPTRPDQLSCTTILVSTISTTSTHRKVPIRW